MISTTNAKKILSSTTLLERGLIIVVLILAGLLVTFIVIRALPNSLNTETAKVQVCRSEECEIIGSNILQSMDPKKDPCDNFFDYSCGRWKENSEIPLDLDEYGILQVMREDLALKNRDLLVNATGVSNVAVENTKQFYHSCMDEDAINKYSVKSLYNFLDEVGGWPLFNQNWNGDDYSVMSAIAKIQLRTSFGLGIQVSIEVDSRNVTGNILQIDSPSLILSKDVLLNRTSEFSKKEVFHYKQFFKQILKLLGVNAGVDARFQEIMELETYLAKAMKQNSEDTDGIRLSIAELHTKIPEINWLDFLQEITNSTLKTLNNDTIVKSDEVIIVSDIEYLQKVAGYLINGNRKRQIANYLGWRVVVSRLMHLPSEFNDAVQEYSTASGFNFTLPSRWKTCVASTTTAFSDEVSFLYLHRYFPEETKNEVRKLVIDLKYQFKHRLQYNTWMDEKTKKAALLKLSSMESNVGYPSWMADEGEITDRYSKENKPNMTDNIFENDLAMFSHVAKVAILKLRKKNENKRWTLSPVTVNAAYSRNINTITFPAAFLQLPIYSSVTPKFYHYAILGALIGHEITHGFDNKGRLRNGSGELQNWWTETSEKEFLRRSECFVDQYNSYGLYGRRSLAENIADNAGMWQAYSEFRRWEAKQQDILSLPGLENFSIQQQFFLSYASMWCAKYRPDMWNRTVHYNIHSPAPYRLIGTLTNLPDFSAAFNCPRNTSRKNCVIW